MGRGCRSACRSVCTWVIVAGLFALLPACFSSPVPSCAVVCDKDHSCPTGMACDTATNLCSTLPLSSCDPSAADAGRILPPPPGQDASPDPGNDGGTSTSITLELIIENYGSQSDGITVYSEMDQSVVFATCNAGTCSFPVLPGTTLYPKTTAVCGYWSGACDGPANFTECEIYMDVDRQLTLTITDSPCMI